MKYNSEKGDKEYTTFTHEYVDHEGTKKLTTRTMSSTFLTLEEYIIFFEECLACVGFSGVTLDIRDESDAS